MGAISDVSVYVQARLRLKVLWEVRSTLNSTAVAGGERGQPVHRLI